MYDYILVVHFIGLNPRKRHKQNSKYAPLQSISNVKLYLTI